MIFSDSMLFNLLNEWMIRVNDLIENDFCVYKVFLKRFSVREDVYIVGWCIKYLYIYYFFFKFSDFIYVNYKN